MQTYFLIKIIHTVSASLLFGGSLFLFFYCVWAYQKNNTLILSHALRITITMNISVIALCGLLQLISGFALIYLKTSGFTTDWIAGVLGSYGVAALCWLSGIYLLHHCYQAISLNTHFRNLFFLWIILCIIATASMFGVYDLMTIPGLP